MTVPVPFRVGLIGYGFASRTFHVPLLSAEPGLRLAMVSSSDPAKVHADLPGIRVESEPLAVATSPDVDLVVIASPNESHAPLATAALQAGKHVVVDKPFTLDVAEARALISLAERSEKLLSVFHNRRWDSDFLSIRNAIDKGLVGTVTHFESHFDRFRPEVRQRWREAVGPGSGIWFDLGPHLVDQALQLFGLPESVQASFAKQRLGAMADDWAHVILDYQQRRVILHASMLVAGGSPRFIVHGDRGSLVKPLPDCQEQQLLGGIKPGGPGWGADDDPLLVYDETGTVQALPATSGDQRCYYAGIAAALCDNSPNPVSPVQALAAMAVIEAANASAHGGGRAGIHLSNKECHAWTQATTSR